jgi:hypothetical protein
MSELERCLRLIRLHRGKTNTLIPTASGPGFMLLELFCDSPFGWKSMELNTDYETGRILLRGFDRFERRRARKNQRLP